MGGMGGGPMGGMHQGPVKDKPITRQLGCTLEELYSGSTRKMKITRTIFDGSGRATRSEEEILELNVKPGWKKGTKLTFQQKGEHVCMRCVLHFWLTGVLPVNWHGVG
jgi:DnaJ family protein B protein 4